MAKRSVVTPTCEVTGLPLPILPLNLGHEEDFHHHFHPRRSPELVYSAVGGKALRFSRGQDIDVVLHHRYHEIFIGPELPTTEDEKFRLCVLACAGIVPRQAIDLSTKGSYSIVDLSDEEFSRVASPALMHMERSNHPIGGPARRRAVGRFFAEHAIKQDMSAIVSRKVIHKFLNPNTSDARKIELGNYILKEASTAMVRDLSPFYEALKAEGYIANPKAYNIGKIVRNFFTKDHYPKFYPVISESLQSAA